MGTLKSSMYIFVFRMASLPSGPVGACKPGVTTFVRISSNYKHTSLQRRLLCYLTPTRSMFIRVDTRDRVGAAI